MKILFALLAIGGVALAAGKNFIWGDSVVGYGSYVPWGLWVAVYSFMVTLAAGSALAANLYCAFGLERYKEAARPALLISIVSLLFALPLIASDLGHPTRGILVLLHPNLHAFLPWALWSYVLFLLVTFTVLKKAGTGKDTKVLGKVSMLLAAAFLIFESLHFGVVIAHPVWNSAIIIPLFFVTSATLGFATVALFSHESNDGMRRGILSAHLILLGLMVIGQVIVQSYSSTPEMAAASSHTLSSVSFWIYVVFGLILPLALFSMSGSGLLIKAGAFSIFIGLLADKYEFVTSAFSLAQFAELPTAFHGPGLSTHYTPTPVEFGVALGFLSAVIAAFLWFSPGKRT